MDEFLGAILIGSFAAGTADTLSDVDLFLLARNGSFEAAWARRREIGYADDLYAWDIRREDSPQVGTHKFFTQELVFVECLISTPSGGARLAEAFQVLVGDDELPDHLPRRRPIRRSEMRPVANDPGAEVDKAVRAPGRAAAPFLTAAWGPPSSRGDGEMNDILEPDNLKPVPGLNVRATETGWVRVRKADQQREYMS